MRWERLFDDLEAQLENTKRAETSEERKEEERWRFASRSLRDRLLSCGPEAIAVRLAGGRSLHLTVSTVGADWFAGDLVSAGRGHSVVVSIPAVTAIRLPAAAVQDMPSHAEAEASAPRVTLPIVLRDLCRRRAAVTVHTPEGERHGTIDRVGLDHFDLAVHEPGSPRTRRNVAALEIVPLVRVLAVDF